MKTIKIEKIKEKSVWHPKAKLNELIDALNTHLKDNEDYKKGFIAGADATAIQVSELTGEEIHEIKKRVELLEQNALVDRFNNLPSGKKGFIHKKFEQRQQNPSKTSHLIDEVNGFELHEDGAVTTSRQEYCECYSGKDNQGVLHLHQCDKCAAQGRTLPTNTKKFAWLGKEGYMEVPTNTKEELRDEIREMLFVHPLWNGKHKDTNELADDILALLDK